MAITEFTKRQREFLKSNGLEFHKPGGIEYAYWIADVTKVNGYLFCLCIASEPNFCKDGSKDGLRFCMGITYNHNQEPIKNKRLTWKEVTDKIAEINARYHININPTKSQSL